MEFGSAPLRGACSRSIHQPTAERSATQCRQLDTRCRVVGVLCAAGILPARGVGRPHPTLLCVVYVPVHHVLVATELDRHAWKKPLA